MIGISNKNEVLSGGVKMNLYKSILAPILIGFGVVVNLTLEAPLGAILFSFGLLGVCTLGADLFTGKAGYMWRTQPVELSNILLINLLVGYLFGVIIRIGFPTLIPLAVSKVISWSFSLQFFIQSIFCGIIMYIAVDIYKKGNLMGIFFGVPLFILCGFQHCIANIIVLGIAGDFDGSILLAIVGNLIGSIIISFLNT